jgi:hypothetical protein
MSDDLQFIVRQYVPLPSNPSSKGWYLTKCRLCNDYKKRAGFKFEPGAVVYNCFNCAFGAKFIPSEHNSVPDKMQAVFDAFAIPKEEFAVLIFKGFVKRTDGAKKEDSDAPDAIPLKYNNLVLPDYIRPLVTDGTGDVYDELACAYLETEREIDPKSYPFMLANKAKATPKEYEKWKGRLVIPYYRNGNLIFYQGRDILNSDRVRYTAPPDSRDTVLFGYDEIYSYSEKPLYIQEGFFDAHLLGDSVATFTNKMTEQQIEILNRCRRPKVVIPDRKGKGYILALQGLENGWSVSIPDVGESCKDINDAIIKYGRLYVLRSLVDNTVSGFAAETLIKLQCKD